MSIEITRMANQGFAKHQLDQTVNEKYPRRFYILDVRVKLSTIQNMIRKDCIGGFVTIVTGMKE